MSRSMDSNTANDAAEARHPEIERERLEHRTGEIDDRILELREIEREEHRASPERRTAWHQEWQDLWEERRVTARRIAELSPLSVDDSLAAAVEALKLAGQSEALLSDHAGGDPEHSRRSIALETTARVLKHADPITVQRLAADALDRAAIAAEPETT